MQDLADLQSAVMLVARLYKGMHDWPVLVPLVLVVVDRLARITIRRLSSTSLLKLASTVLL